MKKAFTLLELLIVVVVIGVLASLALPRYVATIERAKSAEAVTNVISIKASIDRYWYQNRNTATKFPANFAALVDIEDPNSITDRLYNYTFTDQGTISALKNYDVRAERVGDTTYWLEWRQRETATSITGSLYKCNKLGGPES